MRPYSLLDQSTRRDPGIVDGGRAEAETSANGLRTTLPATLWTATSEQATRMGG